MNNVRNWQGMQPDIGARVFIDESAVVLGDVHIGDDSSVWPLVAIRGDVNFIRIGSETNIQDGSVLHVTHGYSELPDGHGLTIGNRITVGHKVILHGCRVDDNCLIGMGAIVMDGAHIHSNVILGAGSLVPEGKTLDSGLWLGSPARRVRDLSEKEMKWIGYSAKHYRDLKDKYLQEEQA